MPSPAASTASVRNLLRRFGRSRRGSAAVEFALVAPVFFALLFAIIETAIMFFASQVLETITQDSARIIQTGQAMTPGGVSATQTGPLTQAQFKNYVCGQIPALFDCNSVSVDVESYPAFANVTINSQIDSANNFISNMQYNPGVACSIVVVRLFYQWPLYVTGLGYNISNLAGNKRLLAATAAFKNEPYNGSCP
jgi:Flp pilus assembly protein TadG